MPVYRMASPPSPPRRCLMRILLVDGGYLWKKGRAAGFTGSETQFRNLRAVIENRFGKVTESYYFDASFKFAKTQFQGIRDRDTEAQKAMYISVQMEMKNKQTNCVFCKRQYEIPVQAGVDVAMACRAVAFSMESDNRKDEIIWLAGDGDFVQALQYVQNRHVTSRLVAFVDSCSPKLRQFCETLWLSDPKVFNQVVSTREIVSIHRSEANPVYEAPPVIQQQQPAPSSRAVVSPPPQASRQQTNAGPAMYAPQIVPSLSSRPEPQQQSQSQSQSNAFKMPPKPQPKQAPEVRRPAEDQNKFSALGVISALETAPPDDIDEDEELLAAIELSKQTVVEQEQEDEEMRLAILDSMKEHEVQQTRQQISQSQSRPSGGTGSSSSSSSSSTANTNNDSNNRGRGRGVVITPPAAAVVDDDDDFESQLQLALQLSRTDK